MSKVEFMKIKKLLILIFSLQLLSLERSYLFTLNIQIDKIQSKMI